MIHRDGDLIAHHIPDVLHILLQDVQAQFRDVDAAGGAGDVVPLHEIVAPGVCLQLLLPGELGIVSRHTVITKGAVQALHILLQLTGGIGQRPLHVIEQLHDGKVHLHDRVALFLNALLKTAPIRLPSGLPSVSVSQ